MNQNEKASRRDCFMLRKHEDPEPPVISAGGLRVRIIGFSKSNSPVVMNSGELQKG